MDETAVAVRGVRDVGPDTVAIEFETPPGFDAHPGQFVQVLADLDDEEVARFYTLSSPDVEETFEVTVEVDPEGEFGPWLASREPGDVVRVKGPFGDAHYDGEDEVVVLAGGPGIGAAVAIAERALAEGGDAAVVFRGDPRVHADRLSALADAGATVVVVSDGLDDAVAEALDAVGGRVFVYGFADFVDAATDAVAAAGGDPDDALVESFGPAP